MEVLGRQHAIFAALDPTCLVKTLACGAVAVAAGVKERLFVAAFVAHVQMPAEHGRSADLDIMHHASLPDRQRILVCISLTMVAEDICDFQVRLAVLRTCRSAANHRRHGRLSEHLALWCPHQIQRTCNSRHMLLADLGVNRRGAYGTMPKQHLDRPDVGARLQ